MAGGAALAAYAVLPAQPEPVQVLGIDEVRRGRPRWVFDDAAGSWVSVRQRWHVGLVDLVGGQGLLGQVRGRDAQLAAPTLRPMIRPPSVRKQLYRVGPSGTQWRRRPDTVV